MKAWWIAQSARINALSLRERLFLFISLLVVALALADLIWLTPAQKAMKQVQQQFVTQSSEVNRLRAELAKLEVLFDTDSTNAVALREPVPARGCGVWFAERQSAGRGRRGRAWTSPLAAHVYLSVSRRFDGGVAALQAGVAWRQRPAKRQPSAGSISPRCLTCR